MILKVNGHLFIFFFLFATHCGYTLKHSLKDIFITQKGIFVPVFDNRTDETGIEKIFTNAMLRELKNHEEIILTNQKEGALELKGEITKIIRNPTAYTDTGFRGLQSYVRLPSEYGVEVQLKLVLWDNQKKETLWSESFSSFRRVDAPINRTYDFQAPSSIGPITDSLIESTYAMIARDVMKDVYDRMVVLF